MNEFANNEFPDNKCGNSIAYWLRLSDGVGV